MIWVKGYAIEKMDHNMERCNIRVLIRVIKFLRTCGMMTRKFQWGQTRVLKKIK